MIQNQNINVFVTFSLNSRGQVELLTLNYRSVNGYKTSANFWKI